MSSLVKYFGMTERKGVPLHWNRADLDGAPFRGKQVPMLMGEEFEDRTVRVADANAEYFDITEADEKKRFLEVLDGAANGWFQVVFIQRFVRPDTHYVEWLEYYLEDGTQVRFSAHNAMESNGGQSPLSGYP